jgi:hypothetical protein
MIYKVEIRGEKEREAIEIDRKVERKVRLGVKCKAATDKKLKCLSTAKKQKNEDQFSQEMKLLYCYNSKCKVQQKNKKMKTSFPKK